jgi:hypothetical protein
MTKWFALNLYAATGQMDSGNETELQSGKIGSHGMMRAVLNAPSDTGTTSSRKALTSPYNGMNVLNKPWI